MGRPILQIVSHEISFGMNVMFALCTDHTLWIHTDQGWKSFEDIPDGDPAEYRCEFRKKEETAPPSPSGETGEDPIVLLMSKGIKE